MLMIHECVGCYYHPHFTVQKTRTRMVRKRAKDNKSSKWKYMNTNIINPV